MSMFNTQIAECPECQKHMISHVDFPEISRNNCKLFFLDVMPADEKNPSGSIVYVYEDKENDAWKKVVLPMEEYIGLSGEYESRTHDLLHAMQAL